MKYKFTCTNNSLLDIINWLTSGNIVCIYKDQKELYFFREETLTNIKEENLIYVNINHSPDLLCEDEWPWYIKNEGFVEYKSIDILPKDKEHIFSFLINN